MNSVEKDLIVCKQVCKIYGEGTQEVRALDCVDLKIDRGSFLSLCGPSGSGKTTLLNLIGGLDYPSSGSIELEGEKTRADVSQ